MIEGEKEGEGRGGREEGEGRNEGGREEGEYHPGNST